MTLLSRDEVDEIRRRAQEAESSDDGDASDLASGVLRLLADLAAGPPRIFIAPQGATLEQRAAELRDLAAVHRCAVHILPHGWTESNAEQRETFERALRHVTAGAREECAKVVERMSEDAQAPEMAKAIRALNERKDGGA
jgi:hypothetical protein